MHIAVIIFHYELHVPYALQFKYLYPFYVEFKSQYIGLGSEMFGIIQTCFHTYNFWLNWDKFWYKPLAKPEILSTSLVVPRGNVSPLCAKRYTLPPP